MPIRVRLFHDLRRIFGAKTIEVTPDRRTVAGLLEELARRGGEVREELLDDSGEVSYRYTVLVNDASVGRAAWDETRIDDGDEVTLLTLVSGG